MSDTDGTLEAIHEFVELAKAKRKSPLPADRRERMAALDEALRDQIAGARPAPKRIANPRAVSKPRVKPEVAPAKVEVSARRNGAENASSTLSSAFEVTLGEQDQGKLRQVGVDRIPQSAYTPPATPSYLADYYDASVVPAKVSTSDLPRAVVTADGGSVDLDREVRVLLGLERPRPPPAKPAGGAARSAGAPAAAAAPVARPGVQAIVHLMAGGTQRGRIAAFDPDADEIELLGRRAEDPTQHIPMEEVMALFIGPKRGQAPREASGVALQVVLTNDRSITGRSDDYEEGGAALTLVPEPRRGNIDRIWIPAWAVKSLEML